MSMYPRAVLFKNGRAVGTYTMAIDHDTMVVMHLPSDHYDFLGPISVVGKTKEEIERDVRTWQEQNKTF